MILTAIKIYAFCSLLFTALWACAGYRIQQRKAVKRGLPELPPVIRAEELI